MDCSTPNERNFTLNATNTTLNETNHDIYTYVPTPKSDTPANNAILHFNCFALSSSNCLSIPHPLSSPPTVHFLLRFLALLLLLFIYP